MATDESGLDCSTGWYSAQPPNRWGQGKLDVNQSWSFEQLEPLVGALAIVSFCDGKRLNSGLQQSSVLLASSVIYQLFWLPPNVQLSVLPALVTI